MTFPASAWATGDLVSGSQLNGLPVRIADTTLTSVASSIIFGAIPDHYAHLLLVAYLRGSTAATSTAVNLTFNFDSAANYDSQYLAGGAGAASAGESFGAAFAHLGYCAAAIAAAGVFSGFRLLIPHYAGAANNKSVISRWAWKGIVAASNLQVGSGAGFWRSSAAITDVALSPTASTFAVGCRATLYGLP